MKNNTNETDLPEDMDTALLVGRVWRPAPVNGPCVVVVREGQVYDITAHAATISDLLEMPDRVALARSAKGESLGAVDNLMAADAAAALAAGHPVLLAPNDLQPVKAAGVTFAISLLERVIEEQAGGDPARAVEVRRSIQTLIGSDLGSIKPGSEHASRLKDELTRRGLWSQYLEVGIGPDPEVFSKAPPMSSVGYGAQIGLHPDSEWNNPEPEVVIAVNSQGEVVGATLGNDVNLRDIEGRSALLLTKAKDNNGSCAIGPFIRLFDDSFTLDDVRQAEVSLQIDGADGFHLEGVSRMALISRDPLELVNCAYGRHHQYPDGFMLFLGTMFSPADDRDVSGEGFTHHMGDRVRIASPRLGALVNEVQRSTDIAAWTFGIRALYASLGARVHG